MQGVLREMLGGTDCVPVPLVSLPLWKRRREALREVFFPERSGALSDYCYLSPALFDGPGIKQAVTSGPGKSAFPPAPAPASYHPTAGAERRRQRGARSPSLPRGATSPLFPIQTPGSEAGPGRAGGGAAGGGH